MTDHLLDDLVTVHQHQSQLLIGLWRYVKWAQDDDGELGQLSAGLLDSMHESLKYMRQIEDFLSRSMRP